MDSYYRVEPGDRDPEDLRDPENQETEPWSGTVRGRCDKCGGSGETEHECESCTDDEADPNCPSCGGKVRYMLKRDADLNERCQLVKLEGERSTDEDFDADEGALLVKPRRIVSSGKLDWDKIEELRKELAAEGELGENA